MTLKTGGGHDTIALSGTVGGTASFNLGSGTNSLTISGTVGSGANAVAWILTAAKGRIS